jgi:hypothetical protein
MAAIEPNFSFVVYSNANAAQNFGVTFVWETVPFI